MAKASISAAAILSLLGTALLPWGMGAGNPAAAGMSPGANPEAVDPWMPPPGFSLEQGEILPPDAPTHPMAELPDYPGANPTEYIVIEERTIIVDADSREIVEILEE